MPAAHQTRVLAASATRTTSGDTGAVTVSPDAELLAVHINVTAQSDPADGLCAFLVEWSTDGGLTWATTNPTNAAETVYPDYLGRTIDWLGPPGSTGGINSLGLTPAGHARVLTPVAPHYRVRWGITGTAPSFTFSVSDYARVRTL